MPRDTPGSIFGEPLSAVPQSILAIPGLTPAPHDDARNPEGTELQPEYVEEIRRAVARLEHMRDIRTPELLRAASYLCDLFPEYERLRSRAAMPRPVGPQNRIIREGEQPAQPQRFT